MDNAREPGMPASTEPKAGKLKAGVVTGADYLTLLEACREGGYALPAVNVVGNTVATLVIGESEKSLDQDKYHHYLDNYKKEDLKEA